MLCLPALRALASLYGTRLRLVCDALAAPFFRTQLEFGDIVEVAHPPGERRAFDAQSVAVAVGDCDAFLSLVPWSSPALVRVVEAIGPRMSAGFWPGFDIALERDYSKHSADLAFDLAHVVDPSLDIATFAEPLRFEASLQRGAERLLAPLPPWMRVLVVHADTAAEKMWRPERMTAALDRFLAAHEEYVCLVVGMRQEAVDAGGRVVNCCGLPLYLSMQLVARADLFLGVDSCMLHVADLARVPGVGLFGPTDSSEFGFRFGPHRHVQAPSMDAIGARDVAAALSAVAAEPGAGFRPEGKGVGAGND